MNKLNTGFSRLGSIGLPIPKGFARLNTVEGQYIPFSGSGLAIKSNNTYPQILADIAANSPTHGAALQKKSKLTYGEGIDFDLLVDDVKAFAHEVNELNESLNDIINKISYDLPTFGGFALKVRWNGKKKIVSIEHIPFKNVRLGRPVDGEVLDYIISNDWEQSLDKSLRHEYRINTFNPMMVNESSVEGNELIVDQTTQENAQQLIYFKSYSTIDNGFYPSPDYISCLDSCFTEESIGVAMQNQMSNGINGAYIVSVENTILDDESKQLITDNFTQFTSGAQNAGSILFMPTEVKVDKLEALPFDLYEVMSKELRQRIISAHGIPSILLEYSQSGGFNNRADEYEAAIIVFQSTVIRNYQMQIVRVLNGIFDHVTDSEYDLQIKPFEVIFSKDINGNEVTESIQVDDAAGI